MLNRFKSYLCIHQGYWYSVIMLKFSQRFPNSRNFVQNGLYSRVIVYSIFTKDNDWKNIKMNRKFFWWLENWKEKYFCMNNRYYLRAFSTICVAQTSGIHHFFTAAFSFNVSIILSSSGRNRPSSIKWSNVGKRFRTRKLI